MHSRDLLWALNVCDETGVVAGDRETQGGNPGGIREMGSSNENHAPTSVLAGQATTVTTRARSETGCRAFSVQSGNTELQVTDGPAGAPCNQGPVTIRGCRWPLQ